MIAPSGGTFLPEGYIIHNTHMSNFLPSPPPGICPWMTYILARIALILPPSLDWRRRLAIPAGVLWALPSFLAGDHESDCRLGGGGREEVCAWILWVLEAAREPGAGSLGARGGS